MVKYVIAGGLIGVGINAVLFVGSNILLEASLLESGILYNCAILFSSPSILCVGSCLVVGMIIGGSVAYIINLGFKK